MNRRIAYCTIGSANYLGRVQVLGRSLRQYNPGADFHVLLGERPDVCRELSQKTGMDFHSVDDIGCEDWLKMAFSYTITEFNTAVKPFFLEKLMEKDNRGLFYLDPDIEIFDSLEDMERLIPLYDIILTPHICRPFLNDGKIPRMEAFVRGGQFNLGFLGISSSEISRGLLKWWQNVCREYCLHRKDHSYFLDQFWAGAFPSFVEKTYILRDSAYNMAYWNAFQRDLRYREDHWWVDGRRLKFFHFSGISLDDPMKVSVHQNRVSAPGDSDLYRILYQYAQKIMGQEWSVYNDFPYSFGRYENGEPVKDEDRRNYLKLSGEERKCILNPFKAYHKIKKIVRLDDGPGYGRFYYFKWWFLARYRILRDRLLPPKSKRRKLASFAWQKLTALFRRPGGAGAARQR